MDLVKFLPDALKTHSVDVAYFQSLFSSESGKQLIYVYKVLF